jgi:hypothetical protein
MSSMRAATKRNADAGASAISHSRPLDTRDDTAERAVVQAGKFVAVLAYCHGAATLRDTAAKFRRNPSWRSA